MRKSVAIVPAIVTIVCTLLARSAQAVTMTYEAPNTFSASPSVGTTQQVDFESLAVGANNGYSVNFTDATTNHAYKATYDNLTVANYGSGSQTAGAGYTGNFTANFSSDPNPTTNLTFTDTTNGGASAGVKYFGLFWSSVDSNNQLTFYDGNTIVDQLTISDIGLLLNNESGFTGGPYNQYGAFLNFYADAGEQFTKISLTQIGGGGFESDNHTFRVPDALVQSGTPVNPAGVKKLPEPSSIAGQLLLAGCLVYVIKRRKQQAPE